MITRTLAFATALALTALAAPATTTISIVGSSGSGAFNPNPVTIAAGDSVVWTNNDATIHHIVLDDGSYDSGTLLPGTTSPAAAVAGGGAAYHCVIHPSMTGTIAVGAGCSFTLSASSASVGGGAATGTVNVTAAAGCAWTAASNNGFTVVLSGATGSGNGVVSYGVFANPSSSPRTGTMTIAGQTFTITQAGAVCPVMSLPPFLPNPTLGVPYSFTLSVGNGTNPGVFSLQSGSLPPGLTLTSAGVLSGTPTNAGRYTFAISAVDAAGCPVAAPYTVTVLAPAPALSWPWRLALAAALGAMTIGMARNRYWARSG
jgi:plastocyanin